MYREVEDKVQFQYPAPQVDNESRTLAKFWEADMSTVRLGVGVRM